MIPSTIKRAYYVLLQYPMRANGWVYKNFKCPKQGLKVHLGPGQKNYLKGWVNVDANFITTKVDVWANLLNSLPFRDGSIDLFYSHHVIEHLPDSHLPKHFAEMLRCLRPGGGIRIGAPNLGNACFKYLEKDYGWFYDFPNKRKSMGGRFTNFVFCRGEHLTALDASYLTELAEETGFVNISFCIPTKETSLVDLGVEAEVLSKEWESDFAYPHTIIMEARKPK